MREDAPAERGNRHAVAPPLVGAEHALQLGERDGRGLGRGTVRLRAGLAHIGSAAQVEGVVRFDEHEQPPQEAGAAALVFAVQAEGFSGGAVVERRPTVSAVDGAQQLARVVEVAPPQQRGALAGQAVRLVGLRPVIDDDHVLRRRGRVLGMPTGGKGNV